MHKKNIESPGLVLLRTCPGPPTSSRTPLAPGGSVWLAGGLPLEELEGAPRESHRPGCGQHHVLSSWSSQVLRRLGDLRPLQQGS
jgi:hypothetical protein